MTARQVFESTLIELSKVQAPALKLYEFNYLFNKAINQYINKVYNHYDLNQQTTDDLRVLKSTAYLTPVKYNKDNSALHNSTANAGSYLSRAHSSIQSLHGATYEVALPLDYLHLLNCICVFYVAKQKDCWDAGSYIEIPATRLAADTWAQIITDIYNRPSPMRPYYYIHNQNSSTRNDVLPTNPITGISELGIPTGADMTGTYKVTSNGYVIYRGTTRKDLLMNRFTYIYFEGNYYDVTAKDEVVEIDPGTGVQTPLKLFDPKNPGTPLKDAALEKAKKNIEEGNTTATMCYLNPEDTVGMIKDDKTLQSGSNLPRTFKLDFGNNTTENVSLVEKPIGLRAGNPSNVRMEIRYGKDDSVFQLKEVQVDYVKSPQFIRLTQEQIDLTEDTSQIMEFPDYVNQEIINELVHLVMERTNDPRLSNNIQITRTIGEPTPQQAQSAEARG